MGLLKTPMSSQRIELWSGGFLDLVNPEDSRITREDVVAGLSNACRFAGQSRRFYSVAEHSVLVADLLRWSGEDIDVQWAGLMHDAAEAFLGDVTAPLKYVMRHLESADGSEEHPTCAYDDVYDGLEALLHDQFGVAAGHVEDRPVGECDLWAFIIEAQALLPSGGDPDVYNVPDYVRKLGGLPEDGQVIWFAGVEPRLAGELFRQRWAELAP